MSQRELFNIFSKKRATFEEMKKEVSCSERALRKNISLGKKYGFLDEIISKNSKKKIYVFK